MSLNGLGVMGLKTNEANGMNVERARFNMVEQQIRPWGVLDPEVLALLSVVKRENFVPEDLRPLAFSDIGLPLRGGRKMLEPKIEARLVQEAMLQETDRVLEVGTGSGYLAALLAARAKSVLSVEIDPGLVDYAQANLAAAGVVNVKVVAGDAAKGWLAEAPYDVIVLSGSVSDFSPELLQQLSIGGRLVGIVGHLPVMTARRVTRTGDAAFSVVDLFETVIPPLQQSLPKKSFVF